MTATLGLIVTDASPQITLAAARALDCLVMPGVPVLIPDMVYAEVTRDAARLGAEALIAWMRARPDLVRIVPTMVYAEYEALLAVAPATRSRGRGEQAALEVLADATASDPDLHAILLFEDNDIRARSFVRLLPERVAPMSTGDLLRELEAAGRIQSSDHILDEAAAAGRVIDRQRQADPSGAPAAPILRRQLGGDDPEG